MTAHNEAKKDDIAPIVLMPGDPLRAKYIAENFLSNYKIVNNVRNMTTYTGEYKGKKVTIMPSGMGIASMGIYAYELYKFYDVDYIIRIGTSGANRSDIKILDVILSQSSYTLNNFAKLFDGFSENEIYASNILNKKIEEVATKSSINIKKGRIITTDVFDVYVDDLDKYRSNYPKNLDSLASEMESFALFFMAKKFNKNATCLLTVVDSPYDDRIVSSEMREKSLNNMIELALNSILEL